MEINQDVKVGDLQEGADYFFARNISEINTSGIEIETGWSYNFDAKSKLRIDFGYTHIYTQSDEEIISVYLSSHARHLLSTRLGLAHKRFDVSINGLYKNRDVRFAPAIDAEQKATSRTPSTDSLPPAPVARGSQAPPRSSDRPPA